MSEVRRARKLPTSSLNHQIELAQKSLATLPNWMRGQLDRDMRAVFGCPKCGEMHTEEYHQDPDDPEVAPSLR
jgi:hypothetical protein